jgi:hypothetical protein
VRRNFRGELEVALLARKRRRIEGLTRERLAVGACDAD